MPTNQTSDVNEVANTVSIIQPIIPIPQPVPVQSLSPSNPRVSGTSPSVQVTVPNTSGQVTFQLIVTDNLGNQSPPAMVTVAIQSPPVAVLQATPSSVAPGGTITLSGAESAAQPTASIATYTFSLVENV